MTAENYVEELYEYIEEHRTDEASGMKKYMRDQFEFFGIKSPKRKELQKAFLKTNPIKDVSLAIDIIHNCWEYDEREMQYIALHILSKFSKKLAIYDHAFLEHLLTSKSWWDTVDDLASNAVGNAYFKTHPQQISFLTEKWIHSENMWLRRTAIIFQLKYKEKTDFERLKRYILATKEEEAFFIQKANGWALRQYSKFNPNAVETFIKENDLPKLTVKEGSKYLE